jgi:hypothetical protein
MAKGLRPLKAPLPSAAIGRLPSRMPVCTRSHEGSTDKITDALGVGDKNSDLSTIYFITY